MAIAYPDRFDHDGTRLRGCCGTAYAQKHRDDCREWGTEARAAKPCNLTVDGWCMTHSLADGPVYCPSPDTAADRSKS